MSEILDNIYIWLFLVNIESVLRLALVKYMLCSLFTQNCILMYFLELKNPYFVTKNCWKSSCICVFILSKKFSNWFHKNLHNVGMAGRRKLPDPSLNCIFNALSIGVQYTFSFQWTNFGLKYLIEMRKYFTEAATKTSHQVCIWQLLLKSFKNEGVDFSRKFKWMPFWIYSKDFHLSRLKSYVT